MKPFLLLKVVLSDDEEEAANNALSWFGFAESSVKGNGANGRASESSLSIDESFDDDRMPEHSKDIRLTTADVS